MLLDLGFDLYYALRTIVSVGVVVKWSLHPLQATAAAFIIIPNNPV